MRKADRYRKAGSNPEIPKWRVLLCEAANDIEALEAKLSSLRKRAVPEGLEIEEVDLSSCDTREHPGIEFGPQYLAQLAGKLDGSEPFLCVGRFHKQWYGPSFDFGWGHYQYDPPGQNCSPWQRLWRITAKTIAADEAIARHEEGADDE